MKRLAKIVLLLSLTACDQIDSGVRDFAHAPDALECGWVRGETRQLDELPHGSCWLVTQGPSLATTPAGVVDACDVESKPRVYVGGAFVDRWGKAFASSGEFKSEVVDCEAM